jgi:hypothetical protein
MTSQRFRSALVSLIVCAATAALVPSPADPAHNQLTAALAPTPATATM